MTPRHSISIAPAITVILLLGLTLAGPLDALADHSSAYSVECPAERMQALDVIAQKRLAYYSKQFPSIQFVMLSDRQASGLGLLELLHLLGQDATNLDYEHPPELRADLLEVSIARVGIHLRDNSVSSALFRVGPGAAATREELCVITLDACTLARDNRQATRHMLDLPEAVLARLPADHCLNADHHLEYAIDHEIRHCLAAHRGEPIPMSTREYWAGYVQRQNENAADAFAMAMHIQAHGAENNQYRSMMHIRGLALLAGDPDHYTAPALEALPEVLNRSREPAAGLERAFAVSQQIRKQFDSGYEEYLKYRDAASRLICRLCVGEVPDPGLLREIPGYVPERERAEQLARATARHYQALFGRPLNFPEE